MRFFLTRLAVIAVALPIMGISTAQANLIMYMDRGVFEGLGDIAEKYDFEGDLSGDPGYVSYSEGRYYMVNPWETHGITYYPPQQYNIVLTPQAWPYYPHSNVIATYSQNPMNGDVDALAHYDMFGVDLGIASELESSEIDITIITNIASYDFVATGLPDVSEPEMAFYGWTADPGEWIAGFVFAPPQSANFSPALDYVTLGHLGASPIPEPGTLGLMGIGLIGLVRFCRKRLSKQ